MSTRNARKQESAILTTTFCGRFASFARNRQGNAKSRFASKHARRNAQIAVRKVGERRCDSATDGAKRENASEMRARATLGEFLLAKLATCLLIFSSLRFSPAFALQLVCWLHHAT
jgi:hypothetical protein